MRRFHGQRAIAVLIAALLAAAPVSTLAQEVEGRPHLDRKMSDRPGEEGRRPGSAKERALEEDAKKIDEKLKGLDDRKADNDRKPGEDRPSEDRITKADEVGKKIDLTKPASAEVHDIDTLLRETGRGKDELHQRKSADDLSREIIETRHEKGMYGLGTATADVVDRAGHDFVGRDAEISSNGTALVSKDGLRQYRFPEYKRKIDKTQANFERRNEPEGKWISNGHVDVVPE
jgi:hypothetical protein